MSKLELIGQFAKLTIIVWTLVWDFGLTIYIILVIFTLRKNRRTGLKAWHNEDARSCTGNKPLKLFIERCALKTLKRLRI